ncbi:MAG: hypothetical protein PHX27_02680 [Candidatus ainarchaeum sp.]|nr:hypothetical protein [Candidatus ainarchaeum sp.]
MPRGIDAEKKTQSEILKIQDQLAHSVEHAKQTKISELRVLLAGKKQFLEHVKKRNLKMKQLRMRHKP